MPGANFLNQLLLLTGKKDPRVSSIPTVIPVSPALNLTASGIPVDSAPQASVADAKRASEEEIARVVASGTTQAQSPAVITETAPNKAVGPSELEKAIMGMGSDPQARKLREEALARGREAIDLQKAGVGDLEGTIAKLQGLQGGVDLTPLLAASDVWGGTKLLPTYDRPKTEAEKLKELATLQSEIAKRKGDIAKEEAALLRGVASDSDEMNKLKMLMAVENMKLNQSREEARQGRFETTNERQQRQYNESRLKDLSHDVEKVGLTNIIPAMESVQTELAKHEGKTYPEGMSPWQQVIPGIALNENAQRIQQSAQALQNILLNIRSGKAVTESELKRVKDELGTGMLKGGQQLRYGIDNAMKFINKTYSNVAKGYSPEVKRMYMENTSDFGLMEELKKIKGGTQATQAIGPVGGFDQEAARKALERKRK